MLLYKKDIHQFQQFLIEINRSARKMILKKEASWIPMCCMHMSTRWDLFDLKLNKIAF